MGPEMLEAPATFRSQTVRKLRKIFLRQSSIKAEPCSKVHPIVRCSQRIKLHLSKCLRRLSNRIPRVSDFCNYSGLKVVFKVFIIGEKVKKYKEIQRNFV